MWTHVPTSGPTVDSQDPQVGYGPHRGPVGPNNVGPTSGPHYGPTGPQVGYEPTMGPIGPNNVGPTVDSRDPQVGPTVCGAHGTNYLWGLLQFF